jgi:hypothetical protein
MGVFGVGVMRACSESAEKPSRGKEWPGMQLRSFEVEGIDFLGAGVAHQQERSVWCDAEPSGPRIYYPAKIFQAGLGFSPLGGQSPAPCRLLLADIGQQGGKVSVAEHNYL